MKRLISCEGEKIRRNGDVLWDEPTPYDVDKVGEGRFRALLEVHTLKYPPMGLDSHARTPDRDPLADGSCPKHPTCSTVPMFECIAPELTEIMVLAEPVHFAHAETPNLLTGPKPETSDWDEWVIVVVTFDHFDDLSPQMRGAKFLALND